MGDEVLGGGTAPPARRVPNELFEPAANLLEQDTGVLPRRRDLRRAQPAGAVMTASRTESQAGTVTSTLLPAGSLQMTGVDTPGSALSTGLRPRSATPGGREPSTFEPGTFELSLDTTTEVHGRLTARKGGLSAGPGSARREEQTALRQARRRRRRRRGVLSVAGTAAVVAAIATALSFDGFDGVRTVAVPDTVKRPSNGALTPQPGPTGPARETIGTGASATPTPSVSGSSPATGKPAARPATPPQAKPSSGVKPGPGKPDPKPLPPEDPISGDGPSAADTGVPAGKKLKRFNGDLTITKSGTKIDGLDVHGVIIVKANNVRISNTRVRGVKGKTGKGLIHAVDGKTGLVVSDSTLIPDYPSVYSNGVKGAGFTLRRVEIANNVDSVEVFGSNVRIEDSWLHNHIHYKSDPAQNGGPSHNDGVQVLKGRNIVLTGNRITGAKNAAVQVTQDVGAVGTLTIKSNFLDNGSCSIKITHRGASNRLGPVTVANNRFGGNQTIDGCALLHTSRTTMTDYGNVWADGGKAGVEVFG